MTCTSDVKTMSGTASFKSVAQIYDGDDPSPEESRDLSDRAEDRIFHAVLAVPKGFRAGLCTDLVIMVPASELTQDRSTAIISAVRSHFLRRADEVQQDMKLIQRVGLRESGSLPLSAYRRFPASRSARSSREMPSRKSWRTSLLSSAGSRSGSRSSRSCSTGGRKARPRRCTGRLQGCPSAFCPRNERR